MSQDGTKDLSLKRKRLFALCCIILVVAVFGLLTWYVGKPIIGIMKEDPAQLREWVASFGVMGNFVMIGIVIMQIVIAFIPGEPVEVAAGVVFGAFPGMMLCLIGSLVASALIFYVVRKFGMKVVYLFFSKEKVDEIAFLKDTEKLNLLIFILYLIPGTPKDVITYLAGATSIKMSSFLTISMFARIPSVLSSTLFGSMMIKANYAMGILIYGVTIVISVLGILWYKKFKKDRQDSAVSKQKNAEKEARRERRRRKREAELSREKAKRQAPKTRKKARRDAHKAQ